MDTSGYFNLQPSYNIDLNEGQQQEFYGGDHRQILPHHHHSFSSLQPHSSSSSSSFLLSSPSSSSSPIYSNMVQDQLGYLYMGSQLQPPLCHQEVGNNFGADENGPYDQTTLEINKVANHTNLKFTICKKEGQNFGGDSGGGGGGGGGEINGSSVKWMPLRLMKKMMRGDEDQKKQLSVEPETGHLMSKTLVGKSSKISISNNNDNNSAIRVCSDCNTTKTPLWRSGPRGPKSLCNACGIRQRKARRAMAMAMDANGSLPPSSTPSSMMKVGNGHKKTVNNNGFGTQKKRSKVVKPTRDNHHNDSRRKPCFEEFVLKLSKKLSLQQVFPQEEKEAAILLMALSYGIVHG